MINTRGFSDANRSVILRSKTMFLSDWRRAPFCSLLVHNVASPLAPPTQQRTRKEIALRSPLGS